MPLLSTFLDIYKNIESLYLLQQNWPNSVNEKQYGYIVLIIGFEMLSSQVTFSFYDGKNTINCLNIFQENFFWEQKNLHRINYHLKIFSNISEARIISVIIKY